METDQPNTENPDQGTSDEQAASQARSYECTFCKRGFSNAQALGGHMNIHRKHKAKLKQTSNEHQQSLDIPKIAPSYSPIPMNTKQALTEAKYNEERSNIHWPWILGNKKSDATKRDETLVEEVKPLPLFVEKPSSKDQNPSSQVHGNTEKVSSHGSSSSELDLELRLGPEPQDSSAATGTKKYF